MAEKNVEGDTGMDGVTKALIIGVLTVAAEILREGSGGE